MQLLINTGGKGTRLYPLTVDLPKPMLPVEGKPVLERLVLWGIEHGITEFVFLNGFKHEMIEDYFGNGKKWGVSIVHSNEPKPLGSGGPLKYAYDQGLIKGRSAFIMGDLICHVDLKICQKIIKTSNIKLAASDGLRHPYPFRDMTGKGALTTSLIAFTGFYAMPCINKG